VKSNAEAKGLQPDGSTKGVRVLPLSKGISKGMILYSAPLLNEKSHLHPLPLNEGAGGVTGGCADCLRSAETIDMDLFPLRI
jgi:hypothetical protein